MPYKDAYGRTVYGSDAPMKSLGGGYAFASDNPARASGSYTRTLTTAPAANTSILDTIQKLQDQTNAKNKAREDEVRAMLDEVIGMYRPGGTYGQGVEKQLDIERTKALSSGGQALISSGLFNTTGFAGLSQQFEQQVGMPTRMKLEDLRMDKLQGALGQKAQFVTDIQDTAPDYRLLAELMREGGASSTSTSGERARTFITRT